MSYRPRWVVWIAVVCSGSAICFAQEQQEWSEAQIVRALQTGKRPDGRELAPIMPWRAFANLTKSDAHAIAAYLKSLPAVSHRVPGPFGPDEKASVFRMKVVPPEAAAAK